MNKPLSILDALKGKTSTISHLPHRWECQDCGCEWFGGGYPNTRTCECGADVKATDNPEYTAPVSMMTLQQAEKV